MNRAEQSHRCNLTMTGHAERRLRRWGIVLFGTVWLAAFVSPGSVRANVVIDVNNALLNIIQNTSGALVDGPPEVAREIALIDGAMFDAVNAASGSPFMPIAYQGGRVFGASADAAALQAALTVMNSLYGPSSLYQQWESVTGATYYLSIPCVPQPNCSYTNTMVGPSVAQMNDVKAQIGMINAELAALGTTASVTAGISLGTAVGNAMLAVSANDGGQAASLQTLTPFVPTNGNAGVYVPPSGRPAMTPTWGTVRPIGISRMTLAALEATIPVAYAATNQGLTSQAYALEVLQTECQGTGTALPSNVASACLAAGFAPESAAEAQAALYWNDPGATLQPPGHWLQIADTIAIQKNLDLLETAAATATVGLALHAAGIGAWAIKYQEVAWRPVTAIQDCAAWSPNFTSCDKSWSSLIVTPPHPDYVAGHPAFSGAAATALAAVLGTDSVTFTSTSNTYCNGGTTRRNSLGNVMSCTLITLINGVPHVMTYSMPTVCPNGETAIYDGDPVSPTLIGCTLGGVAQSVTGGGCNNAGSQPVLNPDYTANPLYNGSPLICVIAETYPTLSQAAGGFLGAEFSRVVGGIHTPAAVVQALALGNAIGTSMTAPIAVDHTIAATGTNATILSWPHTMGTADNGLLLVGISCGNGASVLGVTYGGQPLRRRLRQNGPANPNGLGGYQNRIEIWYLLAPPSGPAEVVATLSNASNEVHGSASFTGVNQSQPFGESASASGQSITASLNVSDTSSDQVVFSVIAANEPANCPPIGTCSIIVSGGPTAAWSNGSGTTSSDILGAAATAPANERVPVSYDLPTSLPWALGAVALKPAAIRVR
jgi:hypothetical protein